MKSIIHGIRILTIASVLACTASPAQERTTITQVDPNEPNQLIMEPGPAPAAGQLIVGRWRMIEEVSGDHIDGIYEQQHRRLSLRADGTFLVENYVERREGKWTLDGTTLSLGDTTAELIRVDAEQLQLIEDLPEIYRREGPPRKVKITYRRVSESEFGPMLGKSPITAPPKPGRFAAAYQYTMSKLPTMEITIDHDIDGRARIELAADGSATGCLGMASHERSSMSKYATDDGQHHSNSQDSYLLLGFRGTWSIVEGEAIVVAEQTWRDSCEDKQDPYTKLGRLELACRAIAANEILARGALACRIVEGLSQLHEIAINPADTERSGPYTLQHDPMGHISTDMGRPWLILGEPGLRVVAKDDRSDMTPTVAFEVETVEFVERNYIRPTP
jgi:hypothetical protein